MRLGLDQNPAVYIEASNVTRNGDAYVLKITKASLKKMLSGESYQSGVVPLESIVVLDNLERIANNGVYFRSEGDRRGRDQVAGYDYLQTTVYIDNAPYIVDMRVRILDTMAGGENKLYHFTPEAIEVTKKDDGSISTTGRHAPSIKSETLPSSDPTLPQGQSGVNTQDMQNAGKDAGALLGNASAPGMVSPLPAVGQKNTAQMAADVDWLLPLSGAERASLSTGKKNFVADTVSDVVAFVRNALKNKGGAERLYIGKVSDKTAKMVMDSTGVNIADYSAILPGDSVQHTFNHHGDDAVESTRGQRAVTADDIAMIPKVIAAPNSVRLSKAADKLGRSVLIFSKLVGDNYITAQAVTDGRHALTTNSVWVQKKKGPLDTAHNTDVATGPVLNAQSVPPSDLSLTLNVAQAASEVNTEDMQKSGKDAGGWNRETLPGKAGQYLVRAESQALGKLGEALSVPKAASCRQYPQ